MALIAHTERGDGPALLLVHGLMVTGEMFEPVLEPLAARHRVIVPDLRGHGRSRGLGPPYEVPQLTADLVALLDALGVASASVLGYSQGGAVAQQLALDHPARCDHLVLVATYAFNAATLAEKVEGRLAPLMLAALGMHLFSKLVVSQGLERLEPARAAQVTRMIAANDARTMSAAWRAALAFDSRPRLAELLSPTLIVAGTADDAVPLHHAQELHQGIAGSQLTLLEGADHALVWTHANALARAVDAFLPSEPEAR